jgi:hypothetical protein
MNTTIIIKRNDEYHYNYKENDEYHYNYKANDEYHYNYKYNYSGIHRFSL